MTPCPGALIAVRNTTAVMHMPIIPVTAGTRASARYYPAIRKLVVRVLLVDNPTHPKSTRWEITRP